MNKKTVAHLIRKFFSMIVLLSLLFSNFAFRKIPVISVQEVTTSIPALKITNTLTFEKTSTSLAEAIRLAVENHRFNPSYSYYYNIINIVEYGEWGLGIAEKIQKDTLEVIPAEFSMILCHQDSSGSWQVALPNDDDSYFQMLTLFPASLLDNSTKDFIKDAYKISAQTIYSNHYLPWTKNTAAVVYQNYSTHGEGQLDFGFDGNIRSTKAGTLYFAYDSHTWNECTGQTLSWCYSNYPHAWYYDNAVVIKHANGEYSSYLHLQTDSIPSEIINNCNNGNGGLCSAVNIPIGTIIGTVGSIGLSTVAHLHYGTGDLPYGNCNYPDEYDEDGDGNVTETVCTGGIDGTHLISTDFYEKPYTAPNCGIGSGEDPTLCMLYYPTNTDLISQNPGSGIYDDFNSPTLNPDWQWFNEDPTRWSLTASPGNLRIIGSAGDMWSTCNNPTNLLLQQAPDGDFEIQTKVSIHPTTDYQQGGLIIFEDVDNYVKLDVLWSDGSGGENVEFILEKNGEVPSYPWPFFTVDLEKPAFLKIIKSNTTYTGFYSPDGHLWRTVGSFTADLGENLTTGIYAISSFVDPPNCNGYVPDIQVDFDYFGMSSVEGKTAIFNSQSTYDGWVLESGEFTKKGGTKNNLGTILKVGDNFQDKQYRAILSFGTAGIPDNAVITKVILKVKRAGVVGTNPMKTHNGLVVDIKKGKFYTLPALQVNDFQAKAGMNKAGKFYTTLYSGWYRSVLYSGAYAYINLKGRTQLRLRFLLDDDNDNYADILKLYSGNAIKANRPQLIVEYYVP